MGFEITAASPKAKELIEKTEDDIGINPETHHRAKYPFGSLHIGQCFTIPIDKANEVSLRNSAYRAGRKLQKKFTVIKHNDFKVIEVARIA